MAMARSGWESSTSARLRWHCCAALLGGVAAIYLMFRYDILIPELVAILAPAHWPTLFDRPLPTNIGWHTLLDAKILFTAANLTFFWLLTRRTAKQMKVWQGLLRATEQIMPPDWSKTNAASNPSERVQAAEEALTRIQAACANGGTSSLPFGNKARELLAAVASPQADARQAAQSLKTVSGELSSVPALRALDHTLVVALLFSGIIGTFFGLMEFMSNRELVELLGSMKGSGQDFARVDTKQILHGFSVAFSANLVAYILYVFGRLMLDLCEEDFDAAGAAFSETVYGQLKRLFPEENLVGVVSLDPTSANRLGQAVKAFSTVLHAMQPMIDSMAGMTGEINAAGGALAAASIELRELSASMGEHAGQMIAATKQATEHWRASTDRFDESARSLAGGATQMSQSFAVAVERMDSFEKATVGHIEGIIDGMKDAAERNAEALAGHAQQIGRRMENTAGDLLRHMDEVGAALKDQIANYGKAADTLDRVVQETQQGRASLTNGITILSEQMVAENKKIVAVVQKLGDGEAERSARLAAVLSDFQQKLDDTRTHNKELSQALIGAPPNDLPSALRELRKTLAETSRVVVAAR